MYNSIYDHLKNKISINSDEGKRILNRYISNSNFYELSGGSDTNLSDENLFDRIQKIQSDQMDSQRSNIDKDLINLQINLKKEMNKSILKSESPKLKQKGRFTVSPVNPDTFLLDGSPSVAVPGNIPPSPKLKQKGRFTVSPVNPDTFLLDGSPSVAVPGNIPPSPKLKQKGRFTVSPVNPDTFLLDGSPSVAVSGNIPSSPKLKQKGRFTVSPVNPDTFLVDEAPSVAVPGNIPSSPKLKQKGRFTVSPVNPDGSPILPNEEVDILTPLPIKLEKKGRFTVTPVNPDGSPIINSQKASEQIDAIPSKLEKKGRFTVTPVNPDGSPIINSQKASEQIDATPSKLEKKGRFTINPINVDLVSIKDEPVSKLSNDSSTVDINSMAKIEELDVIDSEENQTIETENLLDDKLIENKIIKINNYSFKLITKLGKGAQGSVWLCELLNRELHTEIINKNYNSEFFSLKFMKKPQLNTREDISLKSELKALKRLSKDTKFVINIYETIIEKSTIIMIMEYINSIPIDKYILKLRLKFNNDIDNLFKSCIKIVEQLIKGLKYIHDLNLVHRDIKPENVLLDRNLIYYEDDDIAIPHIKFIDFGLVCGKYKINECVNYKDKQLQTPGTLTYMATELMRKSPYKRVFTDSELENITFAQKTDIFSLGLTIFHIFHSFSPYENRELLDLYHQNILLFMMARLKFLPIKSKLHKHVKYPEFAFFDFIINLMIVDDPEMRFDIHLIDSIFTGKYKYISSVPYVDRLSKICNFKYIKEECGDNCPKGDEYSKLGEKTCQDILLEKKLPLSCNKICSEDYLWKMAKCSDYIPSIDHLLINNTKKTKEELVEWIRKEYLQHIATDEVIKEGPYNNYVKTDRNHQMDHMKNLMNDLVFSVESL